MWGVVCDGDLMADADLPKPGEATSFVMDWPLLLEALDFRIAGRPIIAAAIILMRAGIMRPHVGIVVDAIAIGIVRISARG